MIVSAIVPTYNEERYIARCLRSLLDQQEVDDFEIIVVDGRSEDQTLNVVRSFQECGSRILVVENPRRHQVYAWNIGCKIARGEYIAFISAHTNYEPRHFRGCLDALVRTGADAVGPVQVAVGMGRLGSAIAWCMSSPFGVGNARFRFTPREEEVDSVFSMFVPRATVQRLGGLDERITFDEDAEFSYRLRASGGRVVVTPGIETRYYVRNSLRALALQMMRYGYWRRFTRILHPQKAPLRIYAPPLLVGALATSLGLVIAGFPTLAAVVPMTYALFVIAAGLSAARSRIGIGTACCVALVLPCMHLSYGVGYWRALLTPARSVLCAKKRQRAAG